MGPALEGVTMLKQLLTGAFATMLVLGAAGVAGAQDAYPPPGDGIAADTTTVAPGGTIVLGLRVCRPAAEAQFTFDASTPLGSATADGDGVATLNATIPSSAAPGTHSITGECADPDGGTLTQVLNITIVGAAGAGSLPTTGNDDAVSMTQIALAAVVLGGLLVLAADRRRAPAAAERERSGV